MLRRSPHGQRPDDLRYTTPSSRGRLIPSELWDGPSYGVDAPVGGTGRSVNALRSRWISLSLLETT